jgi:hypothetical protein
MQGGSLKISILIIAICSIVILIYELYPQHEIVWSTEFEKKASTACLKKMYKISLNLMGNARSELANSSKYKTMITPILENICNCSISTVKVHGGKIAGSKEYFNDQGGFSSKFEKNILTYFNNAKGSFMLQKCIHEGVQMDSFLYTSEFIGKKRLVATCKKKMINTIIKNKYSEQYAYSYCECTSNKFFADNKDLFSLKKNSTPEKRLKILSKMTQRLKEYSRDKKNMNIISECSDISLLALPNGAKFIEMIKNKNSQKK